MPRAYVHRVTPDFFDTLRMPIVAGRTFDAAELSPNSTAVIVSRAVVDRFWPGDPPLGKRIKIGPPTSTAPWLTIVGVVPEVNYRGLPLNPTQDPDLYFPLVDRSPLAVLARTDGDPALLTASVTAAIRAAHPSLVIYGPTTLGALVDAQTSIPRFTAWVIGVFAAAALLLSVIGVYGVMSYLVARQTREFGIRLALGARRADIVGVVLRHGAWLIGAGAAIGITATLLLTRMLDTLLYEVAPTDAAAGVGVFALVVTAFIACTVPAIKATRVDPVVALRSE
jgi:hypothetical protein